jgi:hypothetical protein
MVNAERLRLDEAESGGVPWRRWGPYPHWRDLLLYFRGAIRSAAAGQQTGAA